MFLKNLNNKFEDRIFWVVRLNLIARPYLKFVFLFPAALLPLIVQAQTYQVGPNGAVKQQPQHGASNGAAASTPGQAAPQLGWGSNIQNARLAHAAQEALERGDYRTALNYADQAARSAPGNPQIWLLLGYAARLAGEPGRAAQAYQHSLKLDPASLSGKSGLAQAYSMMGQTAKAEQLLKENLAFAPGRADDALTLGDLYLRSGKYPEALGVLNDAERYHPSARAELLLAIVYLHLKQMDQANHYLQMAKHRAPDNPEVLRSLAGYYREVGDYKQAIASLQAIGNPPPDVVAELAYTYQLNGNLEQAASLYKKAADAVPKNIDLQLSAAQAQVGIGQSDAAEPFLKRAETINPNSYRLHSIRGEIARVHEHLHQAVREYAAAIRNLPAHPVEGPLLGIQLHMNLLDLYKNLNDPAASARELKTAQQQIAAVSGPITGEPSFLRLDALIKLNSGDLDGALAQIKRALSINGHDTNNLQLDGDILMKMGRTEEAVHVFERVLKANPDDRYALTSLGYASRVLGRNQDAEKYFERLAQADPSLYLPYLALGDLYASMHEFGKSEQAYENAWRRNQRNPLIVSGAMNNAINSHQIDVAGHWLGRADAEMKRQPRMLREQERYLSFRGQYAESAEMGRKAIQVLPNDRDVVVYLGYDLLYLNQYDDLLKLTEEYMNRLPHEPDIPLLAGYANLHYDHLDAALKNFTETIARGPEITTAYVNRGYVFNDLHQPEPAARDFKKAISLTPDYGPAHLGLAYSYLNLDQSRGAIEQANLAQKYMGDSQPVHVIRATAFAREGRLTQAADEYRAAIRFTPDNGMLHLALGSTLYGGRQFRAAIPEFEKAVKFSSRDPAAYAFLARSYAHLDDSAETRRYVELAEARIADATDRGQIYTYTGEALNTIGDHQAAMVRFREGLTSPGSNRVDIRLAIANVFAQRGQSNNAEREIGLGLLEAQAGVTAPPTGDQFIEAANVFREMHDYDLSQSYLRRAKAAGAPDIAVRIGLANNYVALGDTFRARAELDAARAAAQAGSRHQYQYLLAEASVFQQEHRRPEALITLAHAADAQTENPEAQQALLRVGANEGLRINPTLSVLSDFSVSPIFEDTTVYVLDSKVNAPNPVPPSDTALLPPPRSSLQTQWTAAYHLHLPGLPPASGLFQLRNARGIISVPATGSIVNRNTTDYNLNFGLNPSLRFGNNVLTFDSGVQGTIRRDSRSPQAMNQNLLRLFTYVSTSSFFNTVSMSGYVIHEAGPFTEINLHSHTLASAVDFRVGRPWSRTALVTGWSLNDQSFSPGGIEDYFTTSYVGIDHQFSHRLDLRVLAQDVRAWRTMYGRSGIAQNLRPAATVNYAPARRWNLQFSTAYSSNRGFHIYDSTQNAFSVSYLRPFHRKFDTDSGKVSLAYPIHFSAGIQEETFFNFAGQHSQQFRPYFGISIF